MPAWHVFAYCSLLLLAVPALAVVLRRERPLREELSAPVGGQGRAWLVAFVLATWLHGYMLPRFTFTVAGAAAFTVAWSVALVLLCVRARTSPAARRIAPRLLAIVLALDVVALSAIAWAVRSGLHDRLPFKPALLLAVAGAAAVSAALLRPARRLL